MGLWKKFFNKKARVSYFEIILLVCSIFAFSYVVYQTGGLIESVSAVEDPEYNVALEETLTQREISGDETNWRCCLETKEGATCQDVPYNYEDCESTLLPTKCEKTVNCKPGCCIDTNEGLCVPRTTKQDCESKGGVWEDSELCQLEQCQLGCCVLGGEVQFITESRCNLLTEELGYANIDFKGDIQTEIQCLALGEVKKLGACVIEDDLSKDCKYVSNEECLQITGSSENFHEGDLCTSPSLGTVCEPTQNTACFEGEGGVYFVDSCGNKANIYDASKVDDEDYWSRVYSNEESCGSGLGNIESDVCGNCNRFLGSSCGGGVAKIGDNVCKDLNCNDAPWVVNSLGKVLKTKDRENGESWCIYDGVIGEGKDVVGSRHWRYYCFDGEVKVEPCADYRQEVCVESVNEVNGKEISGASCRTNKWRDCLDINSLAKKEGSKVNYEEVIEECNKNPDCYLKELDFGKGYKFSQCLPNYPTGFNLNTDVRSKLNNEVCKMADFECTKIMVKKISGWKCVSGCDCDSIKFTQQMNDWCKSMGDCGGDVNIVGSSDDGYDVDKAPNLDLSQYVKNTIPIAGQKAEPGEFSASLFGEMFGEEEEESGEDGGLISSLVPRGLSLYLGTIPGLAGSIISYAGASYWGASCYFGANSPFLSGIGNSLGCIGAGVTAAGIISMVFGLEGDAAMIMTLGGAVAGAVVWIATGKGLMAACFPPGPWCIGTAIFLIILAIVMKVLGIGETKKIVVHFSCKPWQAPAGGSDCSKCGNLNEKTCSNYRCESLGQNCELINEGTEEQNCVWNNRNDAAPPVISPWEDILSIGYKYLPNSQGVEIKKETDECIDVFTPLMFGIQTNENAQCKYDVDSKEFDFLENYFGEDNFYKQNHSMGFVVPSVEAIANEYNMTYEYVLEKIGEINLHVKCKDLNGNKNINSYLINMCIKSGSDLTAPIILGTEPGIDSFVKYGFEKQNVTFYINEPAECHWELDNDEDFDLMPNNMNCKVGLNEATKHGWPCEAEFPLSSDSIYYVRCKDKPWLAGTIEESDRKENNQGLAFTLKKSAGELVIDSVEPSSDFEINVEPSAVKLEVITSSGAEEGKSSCYYRFNEDSNWMKFFTSDSTYHEQDFDYMFAGRHEIFVRCVDVAGNVAEDSTKFKIIKDTSSPQVARVYVAGGEIKFLTTEDANCKYSLESCGFDFDSGSSAGSGIEHSIPLTSDTYYVKCADEHGNAPSGCSVVVRGNKYA